jgi:hypothetical protein
MIAMLMYLIYPIVNKKIAKNPKNEPKYFILTSKEMIAAKKDAEENIKN